MKSNQKGAIDFMFIAVLVIVVAVGGFVFWRLQAADETVSDTEQATVESSTQFQNTQDQRDGEDAEEQEKSTIPEGWIRYENNELGISFNVPSNWSISEHGYEVDGTYTPERIEITSQDYEESGKIVDGVSTIAGSKINISIIPALFSDLSELKTYFNNEFGDQAYIDTSVSGIAATQSETNNESDSPLEIQAIYEDKWIQVSYDGDAVNDESKSSNYSEFQTLFESIVIQ